MHKRDDEQSLALQLKDISFNYQNDDVPIPILQKIQLAVRNGEFISILGPSGSGKSTIFRLIVGLEQQLSGSIFLNGEKVEERLGKVGYMPQQDLLIPWRTVLQNAILPLEIQHQKTTKNHHIVTLLKEFGLEGYEDKYPHELSGGMRQRVSFLRATLSNSKVLLLDEPFSALDAMTKLHMQEWLLKQWRRQQATILFITHDVSEALFLSDRIFVITETPVTHFEEVIVPLDRPRKRTDLDDPAALELKNNLINRFRMRV